MELSLKKNIKTHIIPVLIIVSIHIFSAKFTSPVLFDSNEYLSIAQNIQQNHEYSVSKVNTDDFKEFKGESPTRMRQPVYPLFLYLFIWVFGTTVTFVLFIQLLLNIISYFLLIEISILVFGGELFIATKYFLSVYFPFWMLSASILTETVFSFFLIPAVYLLLKETKINNRKLFLFSGLLLGLAFLTRPIALFVILALGIAYLFFYPLTKSVKNWGLIFIGFIIVVSPWFIRNVVVFGDATPLSSDGGYNFYSATLGVNQKPWSESNEFKEIVGDGYYIDRNASEKFIKKGLSNFYHSPFTFFINGIKRVFNTWTYFPGTRAFENNGTLYAGTKIIQYLILATAFIGFVIGKNKTLVLLILAPVAGFTFVLLFSYSTSRFLIPIMPFVIILSGQGVKFIIDKAMFMKNINKNYSGI